MVLSTICFYVSFSLLRFAARFGTAQDVCQSLPRGTTLRCDEFMSLYEDMAKVDGTRYNEQDFGVNRREFQSVFVRAISPP